MIFKKIYILLIMILLIDGSLSACEKHRVESERQLVEGKGEITSTGELKSEKEEATQQWEKGYNLAVDEQERQEAESDCKIMMELISDLYDRVDKEDASDIVLNDEMIHEMQKRIKEKGYPVISTKMYSDMENNERFEDFLKECLKGKSGSIVLYKLHSDGGIGRDKFIFDGRDMYLLSAIAIWNMEDNPGISDISYTRIKEWNYTDKGWFFYELYVPEPPEVTEIVVGTCLVRVKPRTKQQREMSEKYVQGLGYQGNNLLCSNWDTDHMENLDYNGMYEYLYAMKYKKAFPSEDYPNGIPKEEFESLIMEYLVVTAKQIQEYAVFDEKNQTYVWERLGCFNYAPTFFGTSVGEVTNVKENEDGTVTLTVDAVCDMVSWDDAIITHELTVRFADDGGFRYLGNKILDDRIKDIPNYQYRIEGKKSSE